MLLRDTSSPRTPDDALLREEFFVVPPDGVELLREKGLLGKGILHLANTLADLDADRGNLPEEEWKAIHAALLTLIRDNPGMVQSLLRKHGPDAINTNLWISFAINRHWPFNVLTIVNLPTKILEENSQELWQAYRDEGRSSQEVKEAAIAALTCRTDYYGDGSLPTEMAFGILFNERM